MYACMLGVVHNNCRTGNFRNRKFSQIWAIGNSHAGNFRKFLDSWGPYSRNPNGAYAPDHPPTQILMLLGF